MMTPAPPTPPPAGGNDDLDILVETAPRSLPLARPGDAVTVSSTAHLRVTHIRPAAAVAAGASPYPFAVVTLHDMGLNAAAAFSTLFAVSSASTPESALHRADAYHVDILGAEDDAPPIPAAEPWVSLADLGEEVADLVSSLRASATTAGGLRRVVFIASGAGCVIAAEAALRLGSVVAGMILFSPVLSGATTAEGVRERLASAGGWNGTGEAAKAGWFARWLSPDALAGNVELTAKYSDALDRLCAANVGRYVWAHAHRRDVGAAIRAAPRGSVGGRVLLFGGRAAPEGGGGGYTAVIEGLSCWSPGSASLIGVDGAGAGVVEEAPHEVVEAVRLFFLGLGCV